MERTVLIVDRTPAYRRGLGAALTDAGFSVREAGDLSDRDPSDPAGVLVFTIRSSDLHDDAGTPVAAGSDTRLVALVEGRDPQLVAAALRAGVSAVVERDAAPEVVVDAIRAVQAHHAVVPRWAAGALATRFPRRPPHDQWVTDEEGEWLRLLADGRTVASLADEVGYSEREMFRNLHDLYTRIGARSRTGALLWAERHGLLGDEAGTRE